MEVTTRSLWTLIHGMGFGALYLLACSGAIIEIYRYCQPSAAQAYDPRPPSTFLKLYIVAMAALAWLTVLTGTYVLYPWYRAVPPPGTISLTQFPQRLLLSTPATSEWHSLGMEWKEHVAWFVPIAITMVAFVVLRHGRTLRQQPPLRTAVLAFAAASFLAAAIAGFFGAMLNKAAPVTGGPTITLSQGDPP